MFKILLADPDKNARKRIKEYINASNLDYKVIKEVENGKQALEAIIKTKVDLIICDLRLPILSGYHLFKKVLYSYPDTKMIIYAAFDEYAVVQKAQGEGLIDYIFKPLKQQDVERSLTQAKQVLEEMQKIKQEEEFVHEEYHYMLPLFKDRFLINLIHGHLENTSYIERGFKYFDVNITKGYNVIIVKIDYHDKLSLVFDEKEKEIFIFRLATKLQEALNNMNNGTAFINNYDEISIILGNSLSVEETVKIGEFMRQTVKLETVTTATIGIGRLQNEASDINISYKQAKAALRYNYYIGTNSVIHIDYVEPQNNITYRYPIKKEELLVYEAVIGNRQKVMKLALALQKSLKDCGDLPDKLLPKILLDIIVSISRYASEQEINLEELLAQHFSVKELIKKNNLEEAFDYFINLLDKICDFIETLRIEKDTKVFEEAKKYINEKYMKNIQLFDVALYLNIAPQYLDKLFKETEKSTFIEYTNRMRVEKSKALLLKTNMSSEEISNNVGLRDAKYFESVFMQVEGISAIEYKNLNKNTRFLK